MCRSNKRLSSVLFMMDMKTGGIIKIWYEDDWDAFATKVFSNLIYSFCDTLTKNLMKDTIVEEIKAYRKNPKAYLESQLR